MDLDCEDDPEALQAAVAIVSPFGHELWSDDRFMARFEPNWGEHLEAEPIE